MNTPGKRRLGGARRDLGVGGWVVGCAADEMRASLLGRRQVPDETCTRRRQHRNQAHQAAAGNMHAAMRSQVDIMMAGRVFVVRVGTCVIVLPGRFGMQRGHLANWHESESNGRRQQCE